MDAYRTICIAPPPEIRQACKAFHRLNIRTQYRACYRVVGIIACIEYPVLIKAILAHLAGAFFTGDRAAGRMKTPFILPIL